MPGKSRRGRGRHSARIKKRHGTLARVAQERVPVETHEPAAPKVPSTGMPTPIAAPPSARYYYIVTELRTIGILTGVMLAILVVLALVLP
jgi:hypothetical protein